MPVGGSSFIGCVHEHSAVLPGDCWRKLPVVTTEQVAIR
jgi:hypothetical protein